ncbi:hypothetical protein D3248_15050 [Leucobacter zeae]|nr:hypothetical protein [Leucobacter zeae]
MNPPEPGLRPGPSPERRQGIAAGILILAIGLSARFPITIVSSLLGEIGGAYALSPSGLAALSAIPVLLFGLSAPLAPPLVARLGLSRSVSGLLGAVAIATLVRPLGTPALFAGTVVVGIGIALLSILAPQIIRVALAKRGGFWTGVYTSSFGASAAIGAALAVPILHMLGDDVAGALMAWTIPLLIATGLALAFGPRLGLAGTQRGATSDGPRESILRAHGLWAVTGFFGCQALLYFSLTAWLPTIAIDRGMPPDQAGLLLAWMSIAGLPGALLAPTLATRASLRTMLTVIVSVLAGAGLIGLAHGPIALAPLMVAMLGVALSSSFGLGVALIVFTAPSTARTASFSAVGQGAGFAFAALGPLLLGPIAHAGVPWSTILTALVAIAVAELLFGIAGSRASLRVQGRR